MVGTVEVGTVEVWKSELWCVEVGTVEDVRWIVHCGVWPVSRVCPPQNGGFLDFSFYIIFES